MEALIHVMWLVIKFFAGTIYQFIKFFINPVGKW